MSRWIFAVMVGLGLSWSGAALAQEGTARTVNAVYAVKIWGVTAGQLTLDVRVEANRYRASTRQRTTGLVRAAVENSQDYEASAEGVITATAVRPSVYRHQGGRRNRLVEVTFTDTDVVTVATPPMNMGEPPATREQKLGTTDQVSSFVDMMVAPGAVDPCARTIRVFDGRTRFDLVMRPNGTQGVRSRAWRGEARRCSVDYRPIAGLTEEPPRGEDMTFLFGRLGNGLWAPLRIEWPTEDVGMAVIEARTLSAS